MVSDGLLEAPCQIENKEMWFKRIISELKTDDPEEIARHFTRKGDTKQVW